MGGRESVNGQIASINREWQASVWKAHNDKQKRIEMLRRNGGGNGFRKNDNMKGKDKVVGFIPHDNMKGKYKEMMDERNGGKNRKNKNGVNGYGGNKNKKLNYNKNGKEKEMGNNM